MHAIAMDSWKTFRTTHSSGNSNLMLVHLLAWVKFDHSLFIGFDVFAKIDLSKASLCNFLFNFESIKEDFNLLCFIYLDLSRYLLFPMLMSWYLGYFLLFEKVVALVNIFFLLTSLYTAILIWKPILLLSMLVHFYFL